MQSELPDKKGAGQEEGQDDEEYCERTKDNTDELLRNAAPLINFLSMYVYY
jgi:hypothetical protein